MILTYNKDIKGHAFIDDDMKIDSISLSYSFFLTTRS